MDDQNQTAGAEPTTNTGAAEGSAGYHYPQVAFSTMEGVGATLDTAVRTAERFMRGEILAIKEPGTGLEVYVLVDKDGVHEIPESLFDEYRITPKRRQGTATLLSLSSFIDHVNRFSDADTVIFADNNRSAPSLTAVLDYHRVGADGDPRFGKHRSAFAYPLSDEWRAWQKMNAEPMKMVDFAAFLEDRIIDVMPSAFVSLTEEAKLFVDTLGGMGRVADPAKLMQLATEMQVFESSVVRSANNLSTGEGAIEFQTEHMDAQGQKLIVPSLFVLGIPVFKNGPVYQVIARLRYRKTGGSIVFFYELWRTDRVFDHAFDESVDRVKAETERPVFLGRDESKSNAA